MKPVTYSLQFRGQAAEVPAGLQKHGWAPGCALVTKLTLDGLEARHVWSPDDDEALLESILVFTSRNRFREEATVTFARGHSVTLRGRGQLARSVDPYLRHGTVVLEVGGGTGHFAGATGRVTSNFFLSDTGDLTENQLGVVFAKPAPGS